MENNDIKIGFQLKNIELIEVRINAPENLENKVSTFQYTINLEHRVIAEKKAFVLMVTIKIHGENLEKELGFLKVAFSFFIDNFEDFVPTGMDEIKLPDEILTTFNSIAISTARGILFSQFRGTHLHNAVLPVIDPKSFRRE